MWRELEYDLDDAWHARGLDIATRRRVQARLAHAAYSTPAMPPALYWAVDN